MQIPNPKFFTSSNTQKGENYELKVELNSEYREKRKEAVKKVISNMTIGKDVSGLFADVVKNMQTEDLELKKLVYLYLINYAKSQPELVILAVNTFVKDSDDHNPLIRALAIRTMGCLRAEKIINYLLEPLKKALEDSDPYVRKTAALCVAKLFDLNANTAIDSGLITTLQEMLADRNPMVIANAVAALTEISQASREKNIFQLNQVILTKLLAALNECTEWGQICILGCLANYHPMDIKEAMDIVDRALPRLQHVNSSVVLSSVKLIMVYLNYISDYDTISLIYRKLTPSLVTLLSCESEIQYVVLRNINLILQKKPDILGQELRVFFTKYNDPLYVKLEKLQVLVKLANQDNIDQILSELQEYANEVDVKFVRKSVRAIGRIAIKIEEAVEKCIHVLLELIKTRVNYIVQESIVVVKDIFRKYPFQYEAIIPSLCENLESLDSSEAKASLIWIIGEYADRIDNAHELLEYFLTPFKEESSQVQLQLLTATVKLFLKKPNVAQQTVQDVLNLATQGIENPDIRDRAYIYWRLLSTSPQAAKNVVLIEKPPIHDDNYTVNQSLLDELISNIASLASIYRKPVSQVGIPLKKDITMESEEQEGEIVNTVVVQEAAKALGSSVGDLLDLDFDSSSGPPSLLSGPSLVPASTQDTARRTSNMDEIFGSVEDISTPTTLGIHSSPLGMHPNSLSSPSFSFAKTTFLSPQDCQGLQVQGTFVKRNGIILLEILLSNTSQTPMSDFAIQFNVNSFGLSPQTALSVPSPLLPNISTTLALPLAIHPESVQPMEPLNALQVALKNNLGVYYFQTLVPFYAVIDDKGGLSDSLYDNIWNSSTSETLEFQIPSCPSDYSNRLSRNGVFNLSNDKYYVKTLDSSLIVFKLNRDLSSLHVIARSVSGPLLVIFKESIQGILLNTQ